MTSGLDQDTRRHLEEAAERLVEEFTGVFSRETIARHMAESSELLRHATVMTYVPVLAHRFARERLKALAHREGAMTKRQPEGHGRGDV